VIVACPGRLLDLLSRGAVRLDGVEVLVLDEADHMFDMGFLPDVRRILDALPRKRQNLLFSATMPREIRSLADTVLRKPAVVELAHSRPAETIDHAVLALDERDKVEALERLVADGDFRSAIVFLRTKRRAQRLARNLDARGHGAVALQGNMSQGQRERALRGFRERRYEILVATDIAARGLDIDSVSHVVNYDVPNTPDAYTHRIGRTGRSEQTGTALTFVTPADAAAVRAIEKRLGAAIQRRGLADLGPVRGGRRTAREIPRRAKRGRSRPRSTGSAPVPVRPGARSAARAETVQAPVFGAGVVDERARPKPPRVRTR
jgi:superfamily II DNA/RNA helicase